MGRRIQARLLLLLGLGALGPVAALAWALWSSQQKLEREVQAERTLRAAAVAARLDDLLSTELISLEALAARGAIGREARARRHSLVDAILVIDAQGRLVAREPPSGPDFDCALILAEAQEASGPAFTDLIPAPGGPRAWVLAPMKRWDGAFAGVVAGAFDASTALSKAGGTVDLIDGRGAVIASTDPGRLAGALLPTLIHGRRPAPADEGIAFAPLSVAHWGVAMRPLAPAGGPFPRSALVLATAPLALALLFALGAARSVTGPLATLTRAAQRIAAGELSTPIRLLPADEVGRLGHALERMRVALEQSRDAADRSRADLERRVAERTASVRQLLGKVITAQEHERRRVARELHDETSQTLAALAMRLRAAVAGAPEELRGSLNEAAALAEGALEAVHRLIADLRPGVLDDLGLRSAILWLADRHLRQPGIRVRCEFSGVDQRLPAQIETAVFRVAQEAIHNIGRHAHAGSVLIQGTRTDGTFTLDVEDDGAGFDASGFATPGADGRGWGLLGMRERVEMLGGSLRIDSAPGEGTRLALTVPVG